VFIVASLQALGVKLSSIFTDVEAGLQQGNGAA
jgi:hypothetical protein